MPTLIQIEYWELFLGDLFNLAPVYPLALSFNVPTSERLDLTTPLKGPPSPRPPHSLQSHPIPFFQNTQHNFICKCLCS